MPLRRRRDRHDDTAGQESPPPAQPSPSDVERLTLDPLTGAVAPWLFEDRLALMAQRLGRSRRLGALLVVDVDRLDAVNDALGHAAGDDLLQSIAGRVRSVLRPGDTLARTGGDELAVLADDLDGPDEAATVAEAVLAALGPPFRLGDETAIVSASIGIASVDGEEPVAELVRRADVALHRAKRRGGGRWAAYDGSAAQPVDRRLQLEWALRRRLEDGRVDYRYRPVVELSSGSVAIVCSAPVTEWHEVGQVDGPELAAAAAACGLADRLFLHEVAVAAATSATWPEDVPVAVAAPAAVLASPGVAQAVRDTWSASGGRDRQLVVVVDGAAPPAAAHRELTALRDGGVRIALDLAGGDLTLATLRAVPADVVLLDSRLLDELGSDRTRAVVGAVLGVAEVLGAVVVAAGVADEDQLWAARSLGVDLVHGDHIGHAVDAAGLGPWFSPATLRG